MLWAVSISSAAGGCKSILPGQQKGAGDPIIADPNSAGSLFPPYSEATRARGPGPPPYSASSLVNASSGSTKYSISRSSSSSSGDGGGGGGGSSAGIRTFR